MFVGKTLLDSALTSKLSTTVIKGGKGAQQLYKFYHSATLDIKVTDTQWNLEFLALNTGNPITTGQNVYYEETIVLVGGAGTVANTPLAANGGTTVYGWITDVTTGSATYNTTQNVIFTGKNFSFTGGTGTQTVCARYYMLNSAATGIVIPANVIPTTFKLVLESELVQSGSSTNVAGTIEIIVPAAQATGDISLALKADGVSTTPLNVSALASPSLAAAACSNVPIYAQINQILTSAHWYDDVIALSVAGGDFAITSGTSPKTLSVWAIPSTPGKTAFKPPVADLTFTSSATAHMTVGANTGIVTWVAAGASTINVAITAKPSITTDAVGTAS